MLKNPISTSPKRQVDLEAANGHETMKEEAVTSFVVNKLPPTGKTGSKTGNGSAAEDAIEELPVVENGKEENGKEAENESEKDEDEKKALL